MSTRARRCGLVAAHAGCAALAFSTAPATSAGEAKATRARTSPVIGWNTSPARPLVPLTSLPPMKWPYSIMGLLPESAVLLASCANTRSPGPARAVQPTRMDRPTDRSHGPLIRVEACLSVLPQDQEQSYG